MLCISPGKTGKEAQLIPVDPGWDIHQIGICPPDQLFAAAKIAAGSIEEFRRIPIREIRQAMFHDIIRHIRFVAHI